MKKISLRMGVFFTAGMLLFSCSVERNAVSRGGESSYGLGSGVAGTKKSATRKVTITESLSAPLVNPAAVEELAAETAQEQVNMVSSAATMKPIAAKSAMARVFASSALKSIKNNVTADSKMANKAQSFKLPAITAEAKGTSKSWYLTLVLCFFVGLLGIHRFYLGYNWQGWVQLFTLGGLGIWWLIDFVRIILRKLEPRCGIYEDI